MSNLSAKGLACNPWGVGIKLISPNEKRGFIGWKHRAAGLSNEADAGEV